MLLFADTGKSPAQLREDVAKACAANKFGVIAVHDLREKMKEKGVEYDGECLVFEVCNPQKARQALESAPEVSTALPCRISVFRTPGGRMRLATIKPTQMLALYKCRGLEEFAEEVEETLARIMREAAL